MEHISEFLICNLRYKIRVMPSTLWQIKIYHKLRELLFPSQLGIWRFFSYPSRTSPLSGPSLPHPTKNVPASNFFRAPAHACIAHLWVVSINR